MLKQLKAFLKYQNCQQRHFLTRGFQVKKFDLEPPSSKFDLFFFLTVWVEATRIERTIPFPNDMNCAKYLPNKMLSGRKISKITVFGSLKYVVHNKGLSFRGHVGTRLKKL